MSSEWSPIILSTQNKKYIMSERSFDLTRSRKRSTDKRTFDYVKQTKKSTQKYVNSSMLQKYMNCHPKVSIN